MSIIYRIRKLLTIYRTCHPGRMIQKEMQRKMISLAKLHLDIRLVVHLRSFPEYTLILTVPGEQASTQLR